VRRAHPPPEPEAARGWQDEADDGFTLREYWWVLRRHLRLIASLVACAMTLTLLALILMTPQYTASTTLLIERQPPQVLNITELITESATNDQYDYYKTQYELLQSRGLAAQVIKELDLERHPLFMPDRAAGGLVRQMLGAITDWLASLRASREVSAGDGELGVEPGVIDSYLASLAVEPEFGTRLVRVLFTTPERDLSARIANAHVRAYVRRGMELRSQASEDARRFLESKLVELKEKVEASEAALNAYRRERGIVALTLEDKHSLAAERLKTLNGSLAEAEAERIALEAQALLVRKGAYDSLPAVISNSLIQNLKSQMAGLEARHANMASQFKPQYPPLAQLRAELDETRRRLGQEVARVAQGIESAYEAAVSRERQVAEQLEREKERAMALNDASLHDAVLARDVDTNRQLYASVLERMKEMGVAAEVRASNVSVVDRAEVPRSPSHPRWALSLLLAGMLTFIGAVAGAFLLDHVDDRFRNPDEVERYLQVPLIGLVPDFASLNGKPPAVRAQRTARLFAFASARASAKHRTPSSGGVIVFIDNHLAAAGEAYRAMRTALLLSRAGAPPKTLLLTSALSREGKTVTAVNTAIALAHAGGRVLLIDADLRRASCHRLFRLENRVGLSEALAGHIEPEEAVVTLENAAHAWLLPSGAQPPNPSELLGSSRMAEIIRRLSEQYDHIVIDSAPVIPVSDTVALAAMVDGVVLVVGPGTRKQLVRSACARLRRVGAKLVGAVLNQLDVRDPDYYYYSHYYSYHEYCRSGELDA
jgi:capsular exopolysaccharide synthesis family protein